MLTGDPPRDTRDARTDPDRDDAPAPRDAAAWPDGDPDAGTLDAALCALLDAEDPDPGEEAARARVVQLADIRQGQQGQGQQATADGEAAHRPRRGRPGPRRQARTDASAGGDTLDDILHPALTAGTGPDHRTGDGLDSLLAALEDEDAPPGGDRGEPAGAPGGQGMVGQGMVGQTADAGAGIDGAGIAGDIPADGPEDPLDDLLSAGPAILPAGRPAPPDQVLPDTEPGPRIQRSPRIERTGAGKRQGGMDDLDRVLQSQAARQSPARKWVVRLVWLAILGGLVWLAFQPYRFEVGGDFTIQPLDRAEVRARTSGEITELHVSEGDRVEAGTVMAVLSNWNQSRDVAVLQADGARLQAQLDTLLAGPRPEEIALAAQSLAAAEVQLDMRRQDLARQETLFESGTIPFTVVSDARSAALLAEAARDQAAAQLALVQADPLDSEIAMIEATIARNAEELAFAERMLDYTYIRAPVAGQIVSPMHEVPVGHSLAAGGLFAEIEDNRTVLAALMIPEIAIQEVTLGAPVELRLWSAPHDPIPGTVSAIAPRAEPVDFGLVVRVLVELPNPEGRLAANLSGFGKIDVGERPVWEVFTRALQRFFVIEVWSWLP